jgi:hypothetical protein
MVGNVHGQPIERSAGTVGDSDGKESLIVKDLVERVEPRLPGGAGSSVRGMLVLGPKDPSGIRVELTVEKLLHRLELADRDVRLAVDPRRVPAQSHRALDQPHGPADDRRVGEVAGRDAEAGHQASQRRQGIRVERCAGGGHRDTTVDDGVGHLQHTPVVHLALAGHQGQEIGRLLEPESHALVGDGERALADVEGQIAQG